VSAKVNFWAKFKNKKNLRGKNLQLSEVYFNGRKEKRLGHGASIFHTYIFGFLIKMWIGALTNGLRKCIYIQWNFMQP
jgi:hypothetical protein